MMTIDIPPEGRSLMQYAIEFTLEDGSSEYYTGQNPHLDNKGTQVVSHDTSPDIINAELYINEDIAKHIAEIVIGDLSKPFYYFNDGKVGTLNYEIVLVLESIVRTAEVIKPQRIPRRV